MTDDHVVAIVSFEGAMKREIKRVRERLQTMDMLSSFFLSIEAEGSLHSGEIKLTYKVGESEYRMVEGDEVNACVDEYMRQKGWKEVHQAKALTYEAIPGENQNPAPVEGEENVTDY